MNSSPLAIILTVQAALSARLIGVNTAFSDEALYLWAGRLEWSHWLHGTAVPGFPAYFSGAPVIYPPLGALAAALGGLAGARVLSLCFMLGATALLYDLTRRIFDRQSAGFAAALFAVLGPVQFLGAFATYDALAIFLLALATWLGFLAAGRKAIGFRAALLILAGLGLAVADAAKYAAVLFDPVAIVAVACYHWHAFRRRAGAAAGLVITLAAGLAIGAALAEAGSPYWRGVTSTTLSRPGSNWPAFGIWYASAGWAGAVAVLAVAGAVAATLATTSAASRTLVWTLAAAAFLAPAEQARIHVFTSLFKHVAFGAWFAAPVAGFALTAFIRAIPAAKAASARRVALSVVVLSGFLGVLLAADHFGDWADVSPVTPALSTAAREYPGPLLVDDSPPFDYYLRSAEPWTDITAVAATRPGALGPDVRHRRFSVIMLSYVLGGGGCGSADPQVRASQAQCLHDLDLGVLSDIISDGGYRLVARIPYQTTSFRSAFLIYARQGS